jgi:hypothetical protein
MQWPTWDSIGQAAIKQMPNWDSVFGEASFRIAVDLERLNVEASGWALGKSEQEIMGRVKENLQKAGKL